MAFLANIFGAILKFIYETLPALGPEMSQVSYYAASILILTLIYKLAMIPVTLSNIKFQKMNEIYGPEMKKIQDKYKNDPQTMQRKLQEFQREKGYNPLAGCMPIVVQTILVFALLRVMRNPGFYMFGQEDLSHIQTNFFWINDLTKPDHLWVGLPLINGLSQYILATIMTPKTTAENAQMQSMNMSMKYFLPIMIFLTTRQFVSGLALYWAFGNILEIVIRLLLKNSTQRDAKELKA